MEFNITDFLESRDLNKKIFFPQKYSTKNFFPVKTDDSCTLSCQYVESPGADRTVVFFHGNGESAKDYVTSTLIRSITQKFGCHCLIAEYRGYGMSQELPHFLRMLEDAKTIVTEAGKGGSRIILFGRSLGGFPVIEALSRFPEVSGVIMESTYSSLSSFIDKRHPLSCLQKRDLNAFFPFEEKISAFHGPALLIHGVDDDLVPCYHSDILLELFSKQTANVSQFIAMGGHNDLFSCDKERYLERIRLFLEQDMERVRSKN